MCNHKFQIEGDTWTCWGWEGACGLRAPACLGAPPEDAVTTKGMIDLILLALNTNPWD